LALQYRGNSEPIIICGCSGQRSCVNYQTIALRALILSDR
jgi:hypothetical protein